MKILCFSINPIFPDRVSGGASKHLMNLTASLSTKGHQVRIICPALQDLNQVYSVRENLEIWPVLPFHQPFPAPYAITAAELALIVEKIQRQLAWADRFYVHDGELLLPQLQTQIPTILSFRDNYYPESILGSFINQADAVICVSPYSAEVIKASAGRIITGLSERIEVVINGIDPRIYRPIPTDENTILSRLPFDPSAHRFLLHPHRPDPNKGLAEALQVLKYLVKDRQMQDLVLLTPRWDPAMSGTEEDLFFRSNYELIHQAGLEKHVHFLDWLSQADMPSLYSLGSLTLCLGRLPEAFGNVAYESLACGTPSLVCRVGVHRSLLPDRLIAKVDYGDMPAACKAAEKILESRGKLNETLRSEILNQFSIEEQLSRYESIILNAQKHPLMDFKRTLVDDRTNFRLAPWSYSSEKGIYHDYLGKFLSEEEFPGVDRLLEILKKEAPVNRANLSSEILSEFYRIGVLIPV